MNTDLRSFLVCLALFSLVTLGAACGGSDTAETAAGGSEDVAASGSSKVKADDGKGGTAAGPELPEAASVMESFRDMAASEGIYFGEVPEGFPLDFLPLYPDGEIEQSAVDEEDFTLLQVVPGDKDTVFAWYKKFYAGLGWSAGDPMTVLDRTMVGFVGSDGEVDMTMMDRDGGKTFVALLLSPK